MRDKFSSYSRTTVRLDKDLDRFVEEVARVAGVQKAVVFREALYVLAEEESVLTQKRLAPDTLRRLDDMNEQLRRIGVNLNQVARRANIDGVAPVSESVESIAAEVASLHKEVKNFVHNQD
ncbi:plasmid mobilization relaxosome protein MobC [Corynebacterium marquesiae]|uniref:plasmid mobilization relaxosome protein MobC n=1 Tax=Corynebacterium marquesiae TaxID=2913503 RepID=UPI00254DC585|nr:plasmid mobilization relaxosome protein MobC [Corynebacterium marquesiae]MDK8455880.1 plasmid mobilization relaxosome protein MobC [Corynebacterium marquesiae]MDK8726027.1 plasmid mobilization relaxosome protein MobC [Corynebacterium marquesiae]MDK8771316.1 plasmid mobilization relaxosome protein MobC [Corynebacterium marquesiae]